MISPEADRSRLRWLPAGIVIVLWVSMLGEGGAGPTVLAVWHGLLLLLLIATLLLDGRTPDRMASGVRNGLLAFAAVVLIGAALAPNTYSAWLVLLEFGAFLGAAWLAARCGPVLLDRLVLPLLSAAAAQGLIVVVQAWTAGGTRPAGTFLNPNHLGAWMGAALALAWVEILSRERRGRWELWLRGLLSAPVLAGLAASGSRGALLGMFAAATLAVVLAWKKLTPARRRWLVVAAALAVLLGGAFFARRQQRPDPFLYQRDRIWRASLTALIESPWLGTGPGQFEVESRRWQFPDGDPPLRFDRAFHAPHSDWIRAISEFGAPGAAAVLAALTALTALLLRRLREARLAPAARAGMVALWGLVVQSGVSNLSHRPAVWLLAAALVGSLAATPVAAGTARPGIALRGLVAVSLLLIFLVGDVAPYLAWRETRDLPRGRLEGEALAGLERALRRNPLHPDHWLRRAEHIAGDGSTWDLEGYALAREAAEQAVRLAPNGAEYHRGLARVEALACRTLFGDVTSRERAQARFDEAAALAPFDPFIPIELSAFLVASGDPAGARRNAERALALEPESVLPRLLVADAVLAEGGTSGREIARRMLGESEEIAKRWEGLRGVGLYARELLRTHPEKVERLRSMILMTESTPASDGEAPRP